MIDIRQLREDPQPAKDSLIARGDDPARIDEVLAADGLRLKTARIRSDARGAKGAV